MKRMLKALVIATVILTTAANAYAACSSPTGNTGEVTYATNYNMMVFCDGTNWISMAGDVSVTIGGTTNTPGGSDTYVQYNSGGTAFGGSSAFTWNNGTSTLTATNVAGTAATFTTLTGTISTAAQTNITSLGTLSGLTVSGLTSVAGVSATGNISAVKFIGDGSQLTGILTGAPDRIISGSTSAIASSGGNVQVSGTLQFSGTLSDSCSGASDYGKNRRNPSTGHMQVCRQ
jgi:hypothetical protein